MTPIQISILSFFALSLLILGIFSLFTRNSIEINRRMEKLTTKTFQKRLSQDGNDTKNLTWRKFLDSTSQLFTKYKFSKRIEGELTKADIPLRGEEFVVVVLLAGLVCSLLFLIITLNLSFAIIAGLCGLLLPFTMISITRRKRLAKFNVQIGDALLIMSNSLRSGFSFLQAMDMVRKELPDPISKEFGRTFQEMNLGTQTEDALQNMAARVKSDDLDLVITAVLIQRQVGGNLAEVLDNIAETIRERVRIKGQIRSITAQGRISGLVIGILPFALGALMFMISPKYILTLFQSQVGLVLIASAVFSEIVGVVFIKKIVDIEV